MSYYVWKKLRSYKRNFNKIQSKKSKIHLTHSKGIQNDMNIYKIKKKNQGIKS